VVIGSPVPAGSIFAEFDIAATVITSRAGVSSVITRLIITGPVGTTLRVAIRRTRRGMQSTVWGGFCTFRAKRPVRQNMVQMEGRGGVSKIRAAGRFFRRIPFDGGWSG
jgi:hypothetical protein